jgi:hypothetical protein
MAARFFSSTITGDIYGHVGVCLGEVEAGLCGGGFSVFALSSKARRHAGEGGYWDVAILG